MVVDELTKANLFADFFFSSVQIEDDGYPAVFPFRTPCRFDFVDLGMPHSRNY